MDRVKAEQTADNILRICFGLCALLFIVVFVKAICTEWPEPQKASAESEAESIESRDIEVADLQRARLDYYKSQSRYYNLLSLDYEDNLRARGLLEE